MQCKNGNTVHVRKSTRPGVNQQMIYSALGIKRQPGTINLFEKMPKYQYAELGWSLEDNDAMNRLYEDGGLKPDKRYRVYRKDLI